METGPLFILSVPRSYTSLIGAMLGQHPEMHGFPELNLFMAADLKEFLSGEAPGDVKSKLVWPTMRHGLMRTVGQLYSGEQTIDSVEMAVRWIQARRQMSTGEAYRILCRRVHPLIPVDKSPGYVAKQTYLSRIKEAFPNARYIHLVRHPVGQCRSLLTVQGGKLVLYLWGCLEETKQGTILEPQRVWYERNLRILEFLKEIPEDRQLRVVSETFLTRLNAGLARVCDWLGVSSGRYELNAMKQTEKSPYAHIGPVNARLGQDVNFLERPAFRAGKIKKETLDGPLPWRTDGAPLKPEVIELAQQFSYN